MNSRPDRVDATRIPAGEHAGRSLAGLAEDELGRHWLRWALRWPDWPDDFREALEAYTRTRARLIYRGWLREQKGDE